MDFPELNKPIINLWGITVKIDVSKDWLVNCAKKNGYEDWFTSHCKIRVEEVEAFERLLKLFAKNDPKDFARLEEAYLVPIRKKKEQKRKDDIIECIFSAIHSAELAQKNISEAREYINQAKKILKVVITHHFGKIQRMQ